MAFAFVMQNVAANLGGMLTPFGNPQNLYLYSYFNIPAGDFFAVMAIPFAAAFLLILAVCLLVKKEPVEVLTELHARPSAWRAAVYLVLFALSVMIVFRVFPYYFGLAAVALALLLLDRKAFLKVDYGLLMTFCAFFVFAGNMARIPAVREAMGALMERDALLFGTLCCGSARRGQYRGTWHAHRVARQPHHAVRLPPPRRRYEKIHGAVFAHQLFFPRRSAGYRLSHVCLPVLGRLVKNDRKNPHLAGSFV